MAKKTCVNKLKKELKTMIESPPPFIPAVSVNETNITEWHFLIQGPPDTPYLGGWYIGRLKFPEDYPFKPPGIYMCTPNGRFKTGERLCLSMSDFHPELWNPMWSVSTVLTGLLSFMCEDTATTGSIVTTEEEKRSFAYESLAFNMKNPKYRAMFPMLPELATGAVEAARSAESATSSGEVQLPPAAGVRSSSGEEDPTVAADKAGLSGKDASEEAVDEESALALEAALAELQEGDPEAALSRMNRALKRKCNAVGRFACLHMKARTQAALGDLEAATNTLFEATPLDSTKRPPSQFTFNIKLDHVKKAAAEKETGNGHFRAKEFNKACEHYKLALQHVPQCAALWCNLSAAQVAVGSADEGVAAAVRALEIHREYPKAMRRHADALLASGQHGDAAKQYLKCLAVSPKDADLKRRQLEAANLAAKKV